MKQAMAAAERGASIDAQVMDGEAIRGREFADGLSVLASSCFPDAKRGLAEMRRVVRRGRRISIATWTQNYELAAELRAARTVAAAPSCPVAL
jgi:hypothetical protein